MIISQIITIPLRHHLSIMMNAGGSGDTKLSQAVNAKKGTLSDRGSVNAYVVFTQKSSIEAAVKMNGIELENHVLRVDFSDRKVPHLQLFV